MNQSQARIPLSPSSQASTGGNSSQVVSPELHEQLLLSVDHNNHDQHQHQHQKKNLKTEYKSKFTPFDQYVYDEASDKFIKPPSSHLNPNSGGPHSPTPLPRPHLLQADLVSPTSDLASINSQAGDPWYREVVKRNEKANEYRFKSEVGHHSPLLGVPNNDHGGCLSPNENQPGELGGLSHPPTPTHLGEGGPRFTPSDYKRDHLIAHMANNNNFALRRDEAPHGAAPSSSSGNARRAQQASRATAHARSRSQSSRRVPATGATTAPNNTSSTAKQTTSKSHQTTPTRTPRAPLVSSRPVVAATGKTPTSTAKTTPSSATSRSSRPATASASATKRTPSASAARQTAPRSLATTTNGGSSASKTTPLVNSRTTASRAPIRATPTSTKPAGSSTTRMGASKTTTTTSTRAAGLAAGRLPSTSVKAPAKPAASKAAGNSTTSSSSSPRTSLTGASSSAGGGEQKSVGVKSIKTPALSQAKEVGAAEATALAVAAVGATGIVAGATIVQTPEAAQEEAKIAAVEVPEQQQQQQQQQQLEEESTNLIFTTTEAGNMLADELAQAARKEALELEQQQFETREETKVDEEPAAPPFKLLVKRREITPSDIRSPDASDKTELINGLASGGLVSAEDRFDSSERELSSSFAGDSSDMRDGQEEETEEPYSIMPRGEPVPDDFKGDEFHVELRSRHDLGHTWTERPGFERDRETSPPSRDVSFAEEDEEQDLTKVASESEVAEVEQQQPVEVKQEEPEQQELDKVEQPEEVVPTETHGELLVSANNKIDDDVELDDKMYDELDYGSSSPDSQLTASRPSAVVVEEQQVEAINDTNTDEMKHVMESAEFSDQPSSPGDQTVVEPSGGGGDSDEMEQEPLIDAPTPVEMVDENMSAKEVVGISVELGADGEISGKEEPLAEVQEDKQQEASETIAEVEFSTPTTKEEDEEKDLVQEALIRPEETSAPLESNNEAQNVQTEPGQIDRIEGQGSGATIISSGSSESSSSSSSSDVEEEEEKASKIQQEEEEEDRSNKSELLMNIVDLIDGEERRKQEMARKSEVARKSSSPMSPTMEPGKEVLLAPGQLIMEQFDLISGASETNSKVAASVEMSPPAVNVEQRPNTDNDNNNTVEASDMREKELEKVTLVESSEDQLLLSSDAHESRQELQNEPGVGEQKEDSDEESLDSIGRDNRRDSLSSLDGPRDGSARRQSEQLSSKATNDDQQAELDQFGMVGGGEQQAIDLTEDEELKLSNRLTNSEDELILAPRNYNGNLEELAKAEQLDLLAREDRLDGQLELGDGSSAELEAAPSAAETLVEMASSKGSPESALRNDLFGSNKQQPNLTFANDEEDDDDQVAAVAEHQSSKNSQLLFFDNDDDDNDDNSGNKFGHHDMSPIHVIQAPQVETPKVEQVSDLHNSS